MPRSARKAPSPATYEIPLVVDAALVDELVRLTGAEDAESAILEAVNRYMDANRSLRDLKEIGRKLGPAYFREMNRQHGSRN